jgi:hypothetical protein
MSAVTWIDGAPVYDEQRIKDIYKRSGKLRQMIKDYPEMVPDGIKQLWYDGNFLMDMVETLRALQEVQKK